MRQELYATLREKIVKTVPDIMELKFGCRINDDEIFLSDDDGEIGNCVGHTFTPEDGETRIILVDHKENGELETLQDLIDSGDMEINGRDITLADVLRAMQEVDLPEDEFFAAYPYRDTKQKNFWLCHKKERDSYLNRDEHVISSKRWYLALPLHEQSDELGEFLLTIIE